MFSLKVAISVLVIFYIVWRNKTMLMSFLSGNWNDEKTITTSEYEPAYCLNEEIIKHIQREQWTKAREEIFGSDQSGFQGEAMEFYRAVFGTVELVLDDSISKVGTATNQPKPHSLVYYRIFKNANDNIRSMMLEHAFQLDNDTIGFRSHNCLRDECSHRRVYMLPPNSIKGLYFSKNLRRYPFTFVRDPIDRFISAMTEIEYRTQLSVELYQRQINVPMTHPLGTQLRVQEFIQMILSSGASRSLFRDWDGMEVLHLAPMIGTLLLASKLEANPLHIYHLEEFGSEWKRLSEAIKDPLLYEAYANRTASALPQNKTWVVHRSSYDTHKTTLAARAFLGHASVSAFQRYGRKVEGAENARAGMPTGVKREEHAKHARSYLRALCRIYLTDFTCFNYTLPLDCQDLEEEVEGAVEYFAYLHSHESTQRIDTWKDLLRLLLPQRVMRLLAQGYCFLESTPECVVAFVHGEKILEDQDERHHEEL